MPNYDIKDEYGGKIGEIRDKPFGGGNSYDVHDRYGGKVGEISGGGGGGGGGGDIISGLIIFLVMAAFWLIVGLAIVIWKILTVVVPLIVQAIGALVAVYSRSLKVQPKATLIATAVVIGISGTTLLAWQLDSARKAEKNNRIAMATYAAEAPTRVAQATMTAFRPTPTATVPYYSRGLTRIAQWQTPVYENPSDYNKRAKAYLHRDDVVEIIGPPPANDGIDGCYGCILIRVRASKETATGMTGWVSKYNLNDYYFR